MLSTFKIDYFRHRLRECCYSFVLYSVSSIIKGVNISNVFFYMWCLFLVLWVWSLMEDLLLPTGSEVLIAIKEYFNSTDA